MIVFYLYIYSIFIITVKAVVGCYKINFISNHMTHVVPLNL